MRIEAKAASALAKSAGLDDLQGMAVGRLCRGRVVAVLGPTNTGKTHFAVERMLAHRSGTIGFPLRLLAREIYDRIKALRGAASVALVTGEERIGSPNAPYVVATVEAMPVEREVEFLAVDEIQLCADPERGHVFTERLLHARGLYETIFLGSETIRPILKRLVPEAELVTRPRFSLLVHDGHRKLARLPRRSAVVAFSAAEVYAIAELVRRQKGGAAVVMGALSPRTRNAQVALYQSGEVDHLVATDAIGMGLNMDLAHVAFARLSKFDGRESRRLQPHEIGQIAGRAGRHMANGTFGTTDGAEPLDERTIEAVESHGFPPLKAIRWRASALDFASLEALLASLDAPPPMDCLIPVKDALDHRSLALLSRKPEIAARADRPERVRLLWQVCQIPDFRKTLNEAHLHLLTTVFEHLAGPRGRLPTDWFASMVARLDRSDGDIDTLVQRIAHVRTLTYLSHRADWLDEAAHFQERTRALEDKLSDALHERLTQRFVDRRTALLLRSMRERGELPASVEEDGAVLVDGERVGRIEGLRFSPEPGQGELAGKLVAAAARRAVGGELGRRARRLEEARDDALLLDERDRLLWQGAPVGRLAAGAEPLRPRLLPLLAEDQHPALRGRIARRLESWLLAWLERRLGPLLRLREAAEGDVLAGPGRAVAWRLVEGLGSTSRDGLEELLAALAPADRAALARLGVRFGCTWLYLPQLLKAGAIEARARLVRLTQAPDLVLPPAGAAVLRGGYRPASAASAIAIGYAPLPGLALRQDLAERLAAGLRARARASGAFSLPADLAAAAGLAKAELEACLPALGFAPREQEEGPRLWVRAAPP
ncbi:MAG: helicase-related protein, partial [Geminicoccaceae bacterium]|nr:helicase-related protein [Geminicoccaceae bacterium]